MPVYLIIDIQVLDKDIYAEYVQKARAIVKKHGGVYLTKGVKITPLDGGWHPQRIIVIKFNSQENLDNCFNCREYLEIAHLRKKSSRSRSIIVEGSTDWNNDKSQN